MYTDKRQETVLRNKGAYDWGGGATVKVPTSAEKLNAAL